jgi:hypothetical protein
MRSQKKNNRSPRPFKNKASGKGWSGGNRTDGRLPFSNLMVRPKRIDAEKETKPSKLSDKEIPPACKESPRGED